MKKEHPFEIGRRAARRAAERRRKRQYTLRILLGLFIGLCGGIALAYYGMPRPVQPPCPAPTWYSAVDTLPPNDRQFIAVRTNSSWRKGYADEGVLRDADTGEPLTPGLLWAPVP